MNAPSRRECAEAARTFAEARENWHRDFTGRRAHTRRMVESIRVLESGGWLGPGVPMPSPEQIERHPEHLLPGESEPC